MSDRADELTAHANWLVATGEWKFDRTSPEQDLCIMLSHGLLEDWVGPHRHIEDREALEAALWLSFPAELWWRVRTPSQPQDWAFITTVTRQREDFAPARIVADAVWEFEQKRRGGVR